MEVVKQTRTYVLGTEIDFGGEAVTLDEVLLTLSTTATVGNRQLVLTKVERLKAIFNILNEMKAKFQGTADLVDKLNADTGVTDTNYTNGAALVAATTLATAYTLGNALKARINTLLAKLDADAGVGSTNYAAAAGITAADADTRAKLVTLVKELYTDWEQLLCMLDADAGVVDRDYRSTFGLTSPALPSAQVTLNASAVTTASKTVAHRFSKAVADGNGAGYVNTNFSADFTISAVQALTITDSNSTDAADGVELQIQASR